MQNSDNVSRRSFLQLAGALSTSSYIRLTGAALATLAQSAFAAEQEGAAFLVLGADEARDFLKILNVVKLYKLCLFNFTE